MVIAIKCWWGEHWGILAGDHARWTVISNRGFRNCVTEEPLEEVIGSAEWRIINMRRQVPPLVVVARARSKIGTAYDFWKWNCQDLVYWAVGFQPQSPQRDAVLRVLSIAGLAMLLAVTAKRG